MSAIFLVGSSFLVDCTGGGSVAGCFPFLFAEVAVDSFGWEGALVEAVCVFEDVAGVSLDDWGRLRDAEAILEGVSGTCDWKATPIRRRNSSLEIPDAMYSLSSPFLYRKLVSGLVRTYEMYSR